MSVVVDDSVLDVGDTWVIGLEVADGSTVAATVTNPSGSTSSPTPVVVAEGTVSISVLLDEEGRYLAVVTVTPVEDPQYIHGYTVWAQSPTGAMPTVANIKGYLDSAGGTSWDDAEIQDALDAETLAQARVCNIPAAYPDDLAQALKRRVARNLAARQVPIAQVTSFDGGQTVQRVQRLDAEVIRFEGPFLKVTFG